MSRSTFFIVHKMSSSAYKFSVRSCQQPITSLVAMVIIRRGISRVYSRQIVRDLRQLGFSSTMRTLLHSCRGRVNNDRHRLLFNFERVNRLSKGSVHLSTKVFGNEKPVNISEETCPQGIQGDDCVNFKLWMETCNRYGLANCDEQLQGIQAGRKTLTEVLAEQDQLIADIAAQYRKQQVSDKYADAQGVQGDFSAFPLMDAPCPQGIQGSDCARFKLWLENCHRFGLHDCSQQYESLRLGRKTLSQIFTEQEIAIREAATVVYQRRFLSSNSGDRKNPKDEEVMKEDEAVVKEDVTQLTQRQKLQRAIKEYGSTVIVFHISISLMSLGFFYTLVSSGIDVVGMLSYLGIGETILQNKLAAGTGTFVVAYAVHKVFAPVRIAITLGSTPFIVNYLRRIGFLKAAQKK